MNGETEVGGDRQTLLRLSADVVAAYVAQNEIEAREVPDLIRSVHDALSGLGSGDAADDAGAAKAPPEKRKPAVPVSKSIQDEYIVCLEDGKKLKMLKRYLRAQYGLTPEEYRRRWNLPPDYPMVAPAYAAKRSDFAKQIGLGKGVRKGK